MGQLPRAAKKNGGGQEIWERFPGKVVTEASFPLPHQATGLLTGASDFQQHKPLPAPNSIQLDPGQVHTRWPIGGAFVSTKMVRGEEGRRGVLGKGSESGSPEGAGSGKLKEKRF